MKKSIFASCILVSLILMSGVSYSHSCGSGPKTEVAFKGDASKLIAVYSYPELISAPVLVLKGYDVAAIEPEIVFVNAVGKGETFVTIASRTVKPVMHRLPNSYG